MNCRSRLLRIPALALGIVSLPVSAQAMREPFQATMGCDAPFGHKCFFTFFDDAAVPVLFLEVPAGQRMSVPVYGNQNYVYVVTIDYNLTTDPTCRLAQRYGVFCKLELVRPGYNN